MASYASIRTTTMLLGVLLLAGIADGQQTTSTNCTLSGNTANCTSNTTDYGAQQQRAYEEGQQVGHAIGAPLGQAIYRARLHHALKKSVKRYCAGHPGQDWYFYGRSGYCPSDGDKIVAAEAKFMTHHKDFIPGATNNYAINAYISVHDLDPRKNKSYELAYNNLKTAGKLKLYQKK